MIQYKLEDGETATGHLDRYSTSIEVASILALRPLRQMSKTHNGHDGGLLIIATL